MSLDVYLKKIQLTTIYSESVTHNLSTMADRAGIYKELWRPDDIGVTKAHQLIPQLKVGLAELRSRPEFYKGFNPTNGWGNYEGLCSFVENYLNECIENPDAEVHVSR